MAKHTMEELKQWQALPLSVKIRMTETRIRDWVSEYGTDGVYISFSGGKDSTVLVDIVRNRLGYEEIPAVFCDTGLEYPEIREFVKTFDNVVWLKPKKNFKQVIKEYGYPFISKEVSEVVEGAKKYLTRLIEENTLTTDRQTDRQTAYSYQLDRLLGIGKYQGVTPNNQNMEYLAKILHERMHNREGGSNQRLAQILGIITKDRNITTDISDSNRTNFSYERYKFLLGAPFDISNKCCNVMKKNPSHAYEKKTGRKVITGQMASESKLRTQKWLQNGCNAYESKKPTSNPMSFWTEQDVLLYIKEYNIPICSVYGEIVQDYEAEGQVEGQIDFSELGLFEKERHLLKTTGCDRTGCMFCGFGCHLEKESRFERMKETHPAQYEWIMKPIEQGGLGYKEVIDWLNENGNLNIKY